LDYFEELNLDFVVRSESEALSAEFPFLIDHDDGAPPRPADVRSPDGVWNYEPRTIVATFAHPGGNPTCYRSAGQSRVDPTPSRIHSNQRRKS